MNKKTSIIISIISISTILLIMLGITYGYYVTQIKDNSNSKSIEITSANLRLVYGDGNGVLTPAKSLYPGEDVTFLDKNGKTVKSKTFTVTNHGTVKIDEYVVVLENVVNNIYLRDDMTYTLSCSSVDKDTNLTKGSCKGVTNIPFPRKDEIMVTNAIDANTIHKYTLTLNYEETEENQSIDMGKTLSAKINIYDRREKNPLLIDDNNILTYINALDTLETHAINYLTENGKDPTSLNSDTYFKGHSKWLMFNTISKISYRAGNWGIVAGNEDSNFNTYLKDKFDVKTTFENMSYKANENGETSGVVHYSAALTAKMYNTDGLYNLGMAEGDFDNLAGWAGDLQTLIANNLIPKITNTNDYNHVYNTMSSLIGKSGTYFDSDDLYADIDAFNTYYLFTNTNKVKDIMTDYFTKKYKKRFDLFIRYLAGSLDYDAFSEKVYSYTKKSSWPLYENVDQTKFTSTVETAARDAFSDYIWYLANFKELNIFSHSIEFEKGEKSEFISEFINTNNEKEDSLTNTDYTWSVTNTDGSNCLSTISNGVLTIPSNETAKELLITITLNKSNKITTSRIIKLS